MSEQPKVVTEIIATHIEVKCPYCGEMQDGFYGNPMGKRFECDHCDEEYGVHFDADIELGV